MDRTITTSFQKPTYRKEDLLPELVLGTAGLGGAWGKIDKQESIDTILIAMDSGINRLDTAPAYANAEAIVGESLKLWRGTQPFISTKVGKLKGTAEAENLNNYEISIMRKSIEQSRKALDRDQLDLIFLHEPEKVPAAKVDEVVDFMQKLKQTGVAKQIGLGGIVPEAYHQALKDHIFDVVMSFNNINACCLDGMMHDIPFFRANKAQTYQGSALHMGLLGNRFDKYCHEKPEWITQKTLSNALLAKDLADENGLKISSLAHRYLLSLQEIDFFVVGPKNMEQLKRTLKDISAGKLAEYLFDQLNNQLA